MKFKIVQLKKLSTRWSYFAAISRGLEDIDDFCEILNFDRPPLVML